MMSQMKQSTNASIAVHMLQPILHLVVIVFKFPAISFYLESCLLHRNRIDTKQILCVYFLILPI